MERLFWVCTASALGGGARYLLSLWLFSLAGGGFPWGTLAVNLLGSFLIGGVMGASLLGGSLSELARLAVATGFLGGFTTLSALSYETLRMLQEELWGAAAMYIAVTVLGGLAACAFGWSLAARLFGH